MPKVGRIARRESLQRRGGPRDPRARAIHCVQRSIPTQVSLRGVLFTAAAFVHQVHWRSTRQYPAGCWGGGCCPGKPGSDMNRGSATYWLLIIKNATAVSSIDAGVVTSRPT
ncbi:hypothetical protein V7x_50730 [Crateriforma conspicua]|uniref:Uncharacterized protein n=1 Tax=Crateriforma conspicua TaxID=2527996 RepID=A0A5C6FS48_9PLAN|nr:hypothetical protein V7x_50730 [Crateriforma conspicua]